MTKRVGRLLLRIGLRALPPRRHQWRVAALSEYDALDGPAARSWAIGCVRFAVAEWCRDIGAVRVLIAVAAVAMVVLLDRSPSDIANQITLLAVLLTAAGLAVAAPHRWILVGTLPVTVLVLAHLAYVSGIAAPGYTTNPPGTWGALSLLVLLVGTLPAARLSAGIGRRSPGRSNRSLE